MFSLIFVYLSQGAMFSSILCISQPEGGGGGDVLPHSLSVNLSQGVMFSFNLFISQPEGDVLFHPMSVYLSTGRFLLPILFVHLMQGALFYLILCLYILARGRCSYSCFANCSQDRCVSHLLSTSCYSVSILCMYPARLR